MRKEFLQVLFIAWFFDSWGFWWGSRGGTLMELRAATEHGLGTALGLALVLALVLGLSGLLDRYAPRRKAAARPIGTATAQQQPDGLHVRMHITNDDVLARIRSRQP